MMRRLASVAIVVATVTLAAVAAKQFVMPRPLPAAQYPAHDTNTQAKLTIAADPYDTRDKEKALFVAEYLQHGFLPVFMVFTNDGDKPIALTRMKVELLTRDRGKSSPSDTQDLYRRFTDTKRYQDKSSGAKRIPYPIPLPKGDQGAVKKDVRDEFDAAGFHAQAVEPHGTQVGFFFFDVSGLPDAARGASLTITGMRDGDGQEIMYYEISLDKYVNAKASTTSH